ncbi:NAD-dependent epimerase/dehydratase family protein [Rhodococcus sovatensis]|uniref:NAD-dependent epimerase/dehydratase family protein n=1 Tax=Rhodococcus sovatensis TaxID=1805840 RepID=A0ABZ2PKA6_9NOCA
MPGLTVAVTGATGNLGTSVLQALSRDERVESIVGVSRRTPSWRAPKTTFVAADIADDDLVPIFSTADVVIHLAWRFQPTRDPVSTWNTNVIGALAVLQAVHRAGVRKLVTASSVGAYSPGPKSFPGVDEDWPTNGWPGSAYTREKAYLEQALDAFECGRPDISVVRMRPAFLFKRSAADEQRRLFGGPLVPRQLLRRWLIPVLPDLPGLTMQAVHSLDVGRAFAEAAVRDVHGAFNIAAEPILTPDILADFLSARLISLPTTVVRSVLAALWRLHLVPTSPGLFDAVLRIPVMDSERARTELDWHPEFSATEALAEFFEGNRSSSSVDTPPLAGNDVRL